MTSVIKKYFVYQMIFPVMIMMGLAFASTYVVFSGQYFDAGGDALFHMSRFESIYQALASGQWPSRFNFIGFNHQGAAITAMYPWITSLIFILPRFFSGVGPFEALVIGFFIINLLTMMFTWLLMRKLTDKTIVRWLGTIVYQFNGYHFIVMYTRVAMGEAIGYMAVPLVLLGLVDIWNNRKWGWIPLGLGMAIVANGHILSLVLCTIMVIIFELYRLVSKKMDWNEVIDIVKGAGLSLILSAYSLLTMIQIMSHNTLRPPTVRWNTLTLTNYVKVTLMNDFKEYRDTTMGLVVGILMIVFLVLAWRVKEGNWRRWIFASNALLLCCFNFILVPWFVNTPLGTVQFSMRLLVFVSILLSVGITLYFEQQELTAKRLWFIYIIMGTVILGALVGMIQHNRKGYDYLHRVTPNNYLEHIVKNGSIDYVIMKDEFKTSDYDFLSGQGQAEMEKATMYDSHVSDQFTFAGSTFDSVTWIRKTKVKEHAKLPIIGYSGVDYKITLNRKNVPFTCKNGHLYVELPRGNNDIVISAR